MPELPEVETVAVGLRESSILNVPIIGADVFWSRTIDPVKPADFKEVLVKKILCNVSRHGKNLILEFSQGWFLLVHLKMSGSFLLKKADEERGKHEQVLIHFKNGLSLRFHDPRKFGRILLTQSPKEMLAKLGPDLLLDPPDLKCFFEIIRSKNRTLKPLLLDQTFLAGLGNIYVDECLWHAGLHPLRKACSLSSEEAGRLHAAIQVVLQKSLENQGTSLGAGSPNFHQVNGKSGSNQNQLQAYGRKGLDCRRCRQKIQKTLVAQRGTYFCALCQEIMG